MSSGESKAAHNEGEREGLRALRAEVSASLGCGAVRCVRAAGGGAPPAGAKEVYFVRHGEGHHNVAQREWRARSDWDGVSEPYTVDTDPDSRYEDAQLTQVGEGQARELQPRASALLPELLVVSPMRRATQTALIAFQQHVDGGLKVLANELCHERAGKHTCDRRLSRTRLQDAFPKVDYSLIEEDDPYWGDGTAREDLASLARRCAAFIEWLMAGPETRIAVAAHSAFLLGVFNAVLDCSADETVSEHFATGEMRAVLLTAGAAPARREAPGICRSREPYIVSDAGAAGAARPARDYVILQQLTFAVRPVSLTACGQTVDVLQEEHGYMARGLQLGGNADALDAVLKMEDGSEETLTVRVQHVC